MSQDNSRSFFLSSTYDNRLFMTFRTDSSGKKQAARLVEIVFFLFSLTNRTVNDYWVDLRVQGPFYVSVASQIDSPQHRSHISSEMFLFFIFGSSQNFFLAHCLHKSVIEQTSTEISHGKAINSMIPFPNSLGSFINFTGCYSLRNQHPK